ncbi:MAG: PQQ-binding-like beta-propeller repeat protein [Alphaproteobacteria bacterium]|nr:PQQ-binding-like beta-propeller repeat protein [Alphaproteobacteria bacterium]
MLKHNSLLLVGCLISAVMLSSCSNNKVLPKGTRVSVLDQISSVKPDVADGSVDISVPEAVENADWLQADMNAQHRLSNIKVGTDMKKQWSSGFGKGRSKREFLISKPLVKGSTVYTLDAAGRLSAFNLADGEELWSEKLLANNKYVSDTALKGVGLAIEDSALYITTGFGVVVAANVKDGSKIWERNLQTPLRIAPSVAGDKVFVQSVDNKFYALDKKSGEIQWDYDIAMEDTTMVGGAVAAYSPELDVVITGFSNGEIQAFAADFGSPLWSDLLVANRQAYSSTSLHTVKAAPVIGGETVYVLGSANVLTAIDIRSGMRKWEKEIGGANTPLLIGNTLYVVTNNNELVALNTETGDILWSSVIDLGKKASDTRVFAPLMINGKIVVTTSAGHVLMYNPQDGQLSEDVDLDEDFNSEPIAADGYLLFVTDDAELLAYK